MNKQVRWACPNGCAAVLGPTKPRRDDVKRYCLACSAVRGRLVERTAPALERAREAREAARKVRGAKVLARTEVQETAYYTIAGLDLRTLVAEFCKAPALSTNTPGMYATLKARNVTIVVRRCSRQPRRFGFARYRTLTISICDYPGIKPEDVRETVIHELAHLRVGFHDDMHHGTKWRTVFRLACEQALGVRPRIERRYHGEVAKKLRERDAASASASCQCEGTGLYCGYHGAGGACECAGVDCGDCRYSEASR
jgi:hypothetical protein